MNINKRIFAAILGTNPQIVTESIFAIINKEPENTPTHIYVMSTSVGIKRCTEKLIDEGWLKKVYQHFNLPCPEFTTENCITFEDKQGNALEDIRSYQESEDAADTIFTQIAQWCESPNSQLHLSVGGGRKSLDLHAGLAMNICSRQIDRMSQVLVSDPRVENNPDFFFPSQPINQQIKTFSGDVVDVRDMGVDLIYIDYIRLRDNLPEGIFCSGKSRLEIVAMGRLIYEKQSLNILYNKSSIDASGYTIKLSPAAFALYTWCVEEKLRDKPIASTANLPKQTAIRIATQQYYSFRDHTEKHIETKLKSGTIDASIEKTLNDIEELLVDGDDNDERYKGVKKWASFKTKRLTDANAEIEKSLKSKGLSQLYAFETFDAEGNNVGGRSKLANLRLELAIKNQDISIIG